MAGLGEMVGRRVAHFLNERTQAYAVWCAASPDALRRTLRPGDVLLVEGDRRISRAIRFATQSMWTHAAYYAGDDPDAELVEAELETGVATAPLSKYFGLNTRICRPAGLDPEGIAEVTARMRRAIGHQYDLKHIFDLARYMMPPAPVPARFRRRLLALGSGDPTRAICSSLIAEAFQYVGYPVLPHVNFDPVRGVDSEVLHIRHNSLYVPRDFDLSPYFSVIKPTLEEGFDYRKIHMNMAHWAGPPEETVSEPEGEPADEHGPATVGRARTA